MRVLSIIIVILLIVATPILAQESTSSQMSIAAIAEKGEDVIDYFLNGEWDKARLAVGDIAVAEETVTAAMVSRKRPMSDIYIYEYLVSKLQNLAEDSSRPVQAALTANQITAFLIDLQDWNPQTNPVQIAWMDYLGREMMLQAKAKDSSGILVIRLNELEKAWDRIKPDIISRKGMLLAAHIDNVLVDLENNNDYDKIAVDAAKILDLVDEIEKLYK